MAARGTPQGDGHGYSGSGFQNRGIDRIYRANGYSDKGYTYYPVIVIGAGESGIVMAYKLKKELGFDQFRVFDRQSGLGGTWWINRYPGVAVDVPAAWYSFSFAPSPNWTSFYPPGPEIYQYLQGVCDRFGLTDKIELNTDILGAKWLEREEEWEVTLQHLVAGTGDLSVRDRETRAREKGQFSVYSSQEIVRCKVLISAAGALVEPKVMLDVPGADTFPGPVFHSARWDYSVDLEDKNVLVVGSGCSAAQFVPYLTKPPISAKSVTQIMRSPPWVHPKLQPPFGDKWWEKHGPAIQTYTPGFLHALRFTIFCFAESQWVLFGNGKSSNQARKALEDKLLQEMKAKVPEKYHEILTPDYAIACKRRIYDNAWFSSLHDPKVDLTTLPVTRIDGHGITLGPGRYYPDPANTDSKVPTEERKISADAIILAHGFEIQNWLHPMKITGKGGKDLIDTMMERGGPQAYQGTAMDSFPNFFIIFGPNTVTGHSSVILASENMADYAMKFVKRILRGDVRTVDVKKEAEIAYTNDLQAKMKTTVFAQGGCTSWYFKDGWNSATLPYSQVWFWYRCQFPIWRDWNIRYTRKGFAKLILARGLKAAAFATLVSLVYMTYKQRNFGMARLRNRIGLWRMLLVGGVVSVLERVKDRLEFLM